MWACVVTEQPQQQPQVPALPSVWPPRPDELYAVMIDDHWWLETIAFEVLHGRADRAQLNQAADRLERLARLLRTHQPDQTGEIGT